jgi:hypothetical protein
MTYSKQKGIQNSQMSIPAGCIYRVGFRVPKKIIWQNTVPDSTWLIASNVSNSKVRVLSGDGGTVFSSLYNPDYGSSFHAKEFDAMEIHQVLAGIRYGYCSVQEHRDRTTTTPDVVAPTTTTYTTEGLLTNPGTITERYSLCAGLGIFSLNPSPALKLSIDPAVIAPTTEDGKKSAFIFEVAGYTPDLEVLSIEKAFYGVEDLQ